MSLYCRPGDYCVIIFQHKKNEFHRVSVVTAAAAVADEARSRQNLPDRESSIWFYDLGERLDYNETTFVGLKIRGEGGTADLTSRVIINNLIRYRTAAVRTDPANPRAA